MTNTFTTIYNCLKSEDKLKIKVRYSETDQMSFVYHGNYVKYFEMGRISWLRKLGFSYKEMEKQGILLPVIELKINFRNSAQFDDELVLITKLVKKPSYTIEFDYKILKNDKNVNANNETQKVKKMKNYKCQISYLMFS